MRPEDLRIPEPCSVEWNAMEPRERARFCASCAIEVVDASRHSADELRALVAKASSERVCISYERLPDGRVRTAEMVEKPDVTVRDLLRGVGRGRLLAAASLALAACTSSDSAFVSRTDTEAPVINHTRTIGEVVEVPCDPGATDRMDAGVATTSNKPPPAEPPRHDYPRTAGAIAPAPPPPQPQPAEAPDAGTRKR